MTPIFAEKGELIKWIGAITDVTEHKKTEQELQEKIKKLEDNSSGHTAPSS